jgi:hypothetical protein
LSPIDSGFCFGDQTGFLKTTQDPAEIPCIQLQLLAEIARSRQVPMRELKEDSCLGQRKWAVEESFMEQANEPGVSPIESPDLLNSAIQLISGSDHHFGKEAEASG